MKIVEGEEGESEVFGMSRTKNRAEASKTEIVERVELTRTKSMIVSSERFDDVPARS